MIWALLASYILIWLGMILGVRFHVWQGPILGLDITNIVASAGVAARSLFLALTVCVAGAGYHLFRRRRVALTIMAVGAVLHIAMWLALLANPYFSGRPGYIILPLEALLIGITLILSRRGYLR
ncbi:MAG: hypothetical protein U9P68_05285 [Pseudomonadota bacterium]|nr:hypothetical protein [Pseudomonadota bacterium]